MLLKDTAFEAVTQYGATANPHELWAVLELVEEIRPRLIVEIGTTAGTLWAWWMLSDGVIGVRESETPSTPSLGIRPGAIELVGNPRAVETRQRVIDQAMKRPVDVLVLAAATTEDECRQDWRTYAPLVHTGGLVLIHGIADRSRPGIEKFWEGLHGSTTKSLIGSSDPVGYGVVWVGVDPPKAERFEQHD